MKYLFIKYYMFLMHRSVFITCGFGEAECVQSAAELIYKIAKNS